MNYLLTDEQRDIQAMARDFAEKELRPVVAECDRKGEFPIEVYKKAVEVGLTCVRIPTHLGGPGLSAVTEAIIGEQMGIVDTGFGCAMGASGLGLKPIMLGGTEAQQKYMADLLLGGGFAAFALTEPDAGSDAGSIRTVATKVGNDYVINGRKCFITNAGFADVFIVFASIDRSLGIKGITAFLVDAKTPGISIGKEEDKMGIRLSNTCDVIFEDVKVPMENLIGKEGKGFNIAMAKCFCSDMCVGVVSEAMQVLGGYGYMRDYPIEKLYRDAKIYQIFEGTNEIQKMVISRFLAKEYR